MTQRLVFACASIALAAGVASAQVVLDGNMDGLAVGNAPDNAVAAGAWAFPANYVAGAIAEPVGREGIFSVVPTSSFQPGAVGNSLRLDNPLGTATDNFHLPNIWSQSFNAAPGLVLRVNFNMWVAQGSGGGSIYVGGDNGGGGFSNGTGDRTAQLTWMGDGTLNAANNLGVNVPLQSYNTGVWQNIQIDIDTDARLYDLYWSEGGNPLTQIASDLVFRAPTPALSVIYDRITYVQFGATVGNASSYLDNVVVTAVPAPTALGLLAAVGLCTAGRRRR